MTSLIDRLLDEAEKAQRKGHLVLAQALRDASDKIGLDAAEVARLTAEEQRWIAAAIRQEQRALKAEAAVASLRADHDRRVTELLEANNREVERRRKAIALLRRIQVADVHGEPYLAVSSPTAGFWSVRLPEEMRDLAREWCADRQNVLDGQGRLDLTAAPHG